MMLTYTFSKLKINRTSFISYNIHFSSSFYSFSFLLFCRDRTLHLHFLRSPIEILQSNGVVSGVRLEHTALQDCSSNGSGVSSQKAVGTGITSDLPAQLVLESIGYKSTPIEGAPFNPKLGIIPNILGQVLEDNQNGSTSGGSTSSVVPGLFVCGWLKRGPSGIIGTNLVDAEQTVDTMVQNQANFPKNQEEEQGQSGRRGLEALLKDRGIEVVNFKGWEAIDAEEIRRGAAVEKPREKIVSVEEMLQIAKKASS